MTRSDTNGQRSAPAGCGFKSLQPSSTAAAARLDPGRQDGGRTGGEGRGSADRDGCTAGDGRFGARGTAAQRRQWFFWIAALSLVNSVIAIAGQEWRFIIGLGITQLIHEIGAQGENWGMRAGVISLAVIGFLGWIGHRAANGRKWAFVLGMVVYGIDGAIFLVVQDWIGVGFHAFALFMIFRGYQAARQLSA